MMMMIRRRRRRRRRGGGMGSGAASPEGYSVGGTHAGGLEGEAIRKTGIWGRARRS